MSPIPSSSHALTDDASGAQAWALIQDEALAQPLPDHLPRLNVILACDRLWPLLEPIEALRAPTLVRFSADEGAAIGAAMDRLPVLAQACYHAALRHARTPSLRADLDALLAASHATRDKAMRWVALLERLRQLPEGTHKALRSGRGHRDLGQDLVELGALLSPRWPTLEPLQALNADPDMRLSEDEVGRLGQLGARLLEALRSAPESDWRQPLIAAYALLDASYELVRLAVCYHLEREGRLDEAARFSSLLALSRA